LGDGDSPHEEEICGSDGTWINNANEKKTHAFLQWINPFRVHPDDEVQEHEARAMAAYLNSSCQAY
jgi:hypothetical protein